MTGHEHMDTDGVGPISPVSCGAFEAQASAFLDQELEPALYAALDAHRAGCESCAGLIAELQAIRAEAGALPPLTPERDLWAGIEARIATPVTQLPPTRSPATPPDAPGPDLPRPDLPRPNAAGVGHIGPFRTRWLTAAAAALLLAVGAGTAHRLLRTPAAAGSAPPLATTPDQRATGQLASNPVRPGVAGAYAIEIARLHDEFEARRTALDTSTVRILETNLAIIDRAIAESQAALAADPASTFLNQQLADVMGEKLELIRTAVVLTSGA